MKNINNNNNKIVENKVALSLLEKSSNTRKFYFVYLILKEINLSFF
jgi:hypothetical protein